MKPFQWRKLGKIFDPTEIETPRWMKEFAQAPSTLIFDSFLRVYFSCRPAPDSSGQYISHAGFVDLDRSNLKRVIKISENPILNVGEVGMFDEFGTYPMSVIRHEKKFLAYYGGWTRCESVPFNVAIGLAMSDNGDDFQKIGPGPVLSYSLDEPFVISGPKIRRFGEKFYLFYIAGKKWILDNGKPEPVYKIRSATSNDGVVWQKTGRDLIADKLGEDEAQASPDVIFLNGVYYMFFCYRQGTNYRCKERGYRIGFAYSSNLVDWIRTDSVAGIDVSKQGWDCESVSYPHLFCLDGRVFMMYLGNHVGKYGFGLAELVTESFQTRVDPV